MSNLNDFQILVERAFKKPTECTFFESKIHSWISENSEVLSLPYINFVKFKNSFGFKNMSCSIVSIEGPSDEDLHYHTSWIIALAVKGRGIFEYKNPTNETQSRSVEKGDILVLPKGIYHLFQTDGQAFEYIAFEFSDKEIDYQKHLY